MACIIDKNDIIKNLSNIKIFDDYNNEKFNVLIIFYNIKKKKSLNNFGNIKYIKVDVLDFKIIKTIAETCLIKNILFIICTNKNIKSLQEQYKLVPVYFKYDDDNL